MANQELGGVDIQRFLDDDWQRNVRVFRAAFPALDCPVEGDDLAGLACEEGVDSRLVMQDGDSWLLRNGPFGAEDFADLPEANWTLLVQGVDRWIPGVAELLRVFRFLPRWRTEDIMVSYATDGGNVGPHYDHYDVFLIQGSGRRRWKIGQRCDSRTPLAGHPQMRLLKRFDQLEEVLLEPGDVLYVPPGVAHWGIAEGDDCVTLSVGFRAPAEADILRDWTDHVADQLSDDRRYRDGALRAVDHSAYIPSDAVERVAGIIQSRMTSTDGLAQRFGQTMTAPLDPDEPLPPVVDETRFSQQRISATLVLRLGARLAFDDNYLFADGAACRYAPEARGLIEALCTLEAGDPVPDELDNALAFLLYSQGTLEFEDDADD
ncbi:cupin domain-containing protein [Spongiibacter nanhainus]|uniref:Cupin domain-containing protein n=1 Tax=Spongiibacter nanhainus TaxID=2794344 RepID=A0A7T4R3W2_9GAMM|nr:cupin domain-containing protein [Spongiibacter nanhainus]QQD20005.1 cupin domain-containing protein [Spongiibacter nanhainus]